MKNFHEYNIYQHQKLNKVNWVIRKKGVIIKMKLLLALQEEVLSDSKKQGVTDYKRITIRRSGEEIKIHPDIQDIALKKSNNISLKPWGTLKVKNMESSGGRQTCGRCDEKDSIHIGDYSNEKKTLKLPAFSKTCDIYKK